MTNDPQRPIQPDPEQARQAEHGGTPSQRGQARGTATMTRTQAGQAPPRGAHRARQRSVLPIILGLLGVLALGGLIAGLVVSHTPSTSTAPVTPRLLSTFAAKGSATSPSFVAPSGSVTTSYGYRCPAGTTGHVVAQLETTTGTDIHTIVNSTALSGSGTKTVHLANVGSSYHVAVTAPAGCGYEFNTATTS